MLQKVLVQQLRGELMHNACAAAAVSAAPTPVVLPPTSVTGVAKPLGAMGTLSQRPQLLALPPHPSVGIVVPLAHVQVMGYGSLTWSGHCASGSCTGNRLW